MAQLHFWLLVEFMILVNVAFVGLALCYWAKPLSQRYNAWTTRFRERHPQISKPPTPEAASRNYKIIVILFRIIGAFLFAQAAYISVLAIMRILK